MARMKTDSVEFSTRRTVQEIANLLRQAAGETKASIEKIGANDPLGGFDKAAEIEVVLSGQVGFFGGMKHFRPGAANNIWAVQAYVTDTGDSRHIELIALGEGPFTGGLSNGAGVLNLGSSKEKREKIEALLR